VNSPTPRDTAPSVPVSPQANRKNDYEPPRIESLGTVERLTMGGAGPAPDIIPIFGSLFPSDRRLKDHVTAIEPGGVLEGIASLAGRSA
jgi:hypothetical protein